MKVKVQPVYHMQIQPIPITTDFIKLESFLKLCNAVESGGMAKTVIQDGAVKVAGITCTQRGKKLHDGDTVTFAGQSWKVTAEPAKPV